MSIYKKTKSDIFQRIRRLNLPAGQYAVFGSSLLDVWGLRKAVDLDIIATPELYERLKSEGWEEKQANGFTMLRRGEADITTVQSAPTDGSYNPDRIQLIRDAVLIDGLPFVRIEQVIACKTAYDRQKDRDDLAMIQEYLDNNAG